MPKIKYPKWIILTIPDSWEINEDQNIVSIYSTTKDGVGAINISFVKRIKRDNFLEKDLQSLTKQYVKDKKLYDIHVEACITKKKKYLISEIEYIISDNYWRAWHLLDNKRLIFITYNCDIKDKHKEIEVVDDIINSIEFV